MDCNHVWVGRKDGVTCKLCGEHLTASEYRRIFTQKKPEKEPEKEPEKRADNKSRRKKAADD